MILVLAKAIPKDEEACEKIVEFAQDLIENTKKEEGNIDYNLFKDTADNSLMFVEKWECSYGGQFWFVSTIIQFYLFWPLILKLFKSNGIIGALIISLSWSTFVGLNGLFDERVWNSFFLQYLWVQAE